jgi:superfamily II DNA or RNA helicase
MEVKVDGWAWLRTDQMDGTQLEYLQKKLTLVQKVPPEYRKRAEKAGKPPAVVRCYEDDGNGMIGIAREFFYKEAKLHHSVKYEVSEGEWPNHLDPDEVGDIVLWNGEKSTWAEHQSDDPSELTFFDCQPPKGKEERPVSLKEEQLQARAVTLNHLDSRPACGAIVQAPTGWGKTVFCLAMIKALKRKTAVLVHREFLLDQWVSRINKFLPDAKVGVIRGKKFDVEGCHIVIVMIGTLASWVKRDKVKPELADMFGLVIADEVHRVSAPTWAPVIPLFNAAKRIGVSARPKRSDGLDKCFLYHIGPKVFTGQEYQMIPKIRRTWSSYKPKIRRNSKFNPQFLSKEMACRFMTASPIYNKDVIDQVIGARKAGRKILVFSETIKHLQRLKELFEQLWDGEKTVADFLVGGMTTDERDRACEADVIFGTFQMCRDALDVPALDTVVLASPIRNPEQPAGRCLREFDGKKDPIVVDIRVDAVPVLKEYGESRDRWYKRLYPAVAR